MKIQMASTHVCIAPRNIEPLKDVGAAPPDGDDPPRVLAVDDRHARILRADGDALADL